MAVKLKAVLLDIDGTLVDTNGGHARAWQAALAEAGITVPVERIRPLIGMGSDMLIPALKLGIGEALGASIAGREGEIFATAELPTIEPTPGARELLAYLRERRLTRIVATSGSRSGAERTLAKVGLGEFIDAFATADDAGASKPHPGIIEAALAKGRLAPGEAVMFGDTCFDVAAAFGAGVSTIAFRCGGSTEEELTGAATVTTSPAALLALLEKRSLEELIAAGTAPGLYASPGL